MSYRYGTNRLKGVNNSDEATTRSKCLHCNKIESPSHIYAQCQNPALRKQRGKIFDSQTKALDRFRIDPTCPDWERRFFRRYHRLSFSHRHDRAEKSWNGTINPTDLQTLLGSNSQLSLSFVQFQEFRKRFVRFVSPLTEAAISMKQLQRQSRTRASLRAIPASSRRLSAPRSITRPPLHPAFRPKSPAPLTPLHRPADGDLAVLPPSRRLTQKRLKITHSSDEDASGLQANLSTITFHEFLSQQHNEHVNSSSGRVFRHHEDTESPSPQGLQFHEPRDKQ
jgi:hypothetical protein